MTWTETHRRLEALRAVEAELDRNGDGQVPWRPEYAEIFGNRHTLVLQLRHRWQLLVEAQAEGRGTSAARQTLAAQHPGLLAALRRHFWQTEPCPTGEQARPKGATASQ